MEYYDVVIVGAGIAGCGLAYNLKRMGYKGSVFVIDKKEIGANAAYGYRSTTEDVVKEYNLPYERVYKGAKIGTNGRTYFILNKRYFFLDYKKICLNLTKKSKIIPKQERAINIIGSRLITDKQEYSFKYLIDCSGSDFFAKKLFNQKLPFRYFIGKTKILKNKLRDTSHLYYQFDSFGYIEDLYSIKDKAIHGDWQYTRKIDFAQIIPKKENLYNKKISSPKLIKEYNSIIPGTPVFPLVYKNIAFLGDSFGNALPSSAFAIHVILESSKILAYTIKMKNLGLYEKLWKKKYFEVYLRSLVPKLSLYNNSRFLHSLKNNPSSNKLLTYFSKYPEILGKIFEKGVCFNIPRKMQKKFPRRAKLFQLYYYIYLKLKYALM